MRFQYLPLVNNHLNISSSSSVPAPKVRSIRLPRSLSTSCSSVKMKLSHSTLPSQVLPNNGKESPPKESQCSPSLAVLTNFSIKQFQSTLQIDLSAKIKQGGVSFQIIELWKSLIILKIQCHLKITHRWLPLLPVVFWNSKTFNPDVIIRFILVSLTVMYLLRSMNIT